MSNRLIDEVSPYLLQHAHNPVEWYPWGDEALARAKAEDKPILLSIGYSACHWCHVMERESFEDEATAALMNRLFVNIKVDREERPDLDQIYQLVVQLMRKSGGWPLTVFLTPELKPFFGGTYFPPAERYGMPSFRTVLDAVHEAYTQRRDQVEATSRELTEAIATVTSARGNPEDPPRDALHVAARGLMRRADPTHGGFGDRPKFPNTMALEVLLRAHAEPHAQETALKALDGMKNGGVYDQLGGGFHRYSTDARWLVPHFEKMLYDNALLARVYTDAYRATGRYEQIVRETLDYVEREMRSPDGLFYSTQDADSEGEEGKFFVWTPAQIEEALGKGGDGGKDDARVVEIALGVSEEGNFEETGASVLHVNRPASAVAAQLGISEDDVHAALARAKPKLLAAREQRPKPFRDEKIIATWNGLMIGAFARAGAALAEPRYVAIARDALAALDRTLMRDGALLRIAKDGRARIDGFLEDYADVASAAIDVYEASLDRAPLELAEKLVRAALDRFWDEDDGGFYFTREGEPNLIVRAKDSYDNAVPSGTSSMAHALLRLHAYTGDADLLARAETTLRSVARQAIDSPLGFGHLICAIDRYLEGPTEVVIVADPKDDPAPLVRAAHRAFAPNLTIVIAKADPRVGPRKDDRATAYVCRQRACSAPVTSAAELAALLDQPAQA
jgi:uncharacterized protein YyaL (SSP411 family)